MNNNAKAVVIQESSVMVPSQIGFGTTDIGMLSRGFLKSPRTNLPYQVTVNDREYLAGPNVEMYATPLQRMDFARLGDSAEQQALTYAALGLALGPGEHPVAKIVVGFPVEVMRDEAKAKDVLKALRAWMIGTHRFQINDKAYGITIDKVIVIAQPLGGFYCWAISKEGKFRVPQTEVQGRILVVDIGFNTLDLYALKNMELEPKYTTGDTAGVRRAAELLMQHIQREFDVRVSRTEANALLLSDNPIFETAGRGIDLTPVINQVLDASATQITDICETTVGNGKQFSRVLFTGGGSELLRKSMLKHFPFALVLPNAVMANATGCAYAGMLKWRDLNPELVIGLDPGFGGFKVTALRRCEEHR
jgi:plasmid segregation protein ParM